MPAGSSRAVRLDPLALPVRFAAIDAAADERMRWIELDRERVVLRRAVRGIPMAIKVPVNAFLGVALHLVASEAGECVALSLAIVAVYPLLKRVTYWPQIGLGLAFSWGALMGWAAALGRLDAPALVLYAGTIAWVIGYDTIYAHQDREDDALIGIKSTALLFGERTKPALAAFYAAAVLLIGLAGFLAGAGVVFAAGVALFAAHLGWQIRRLDIADPALCLTVFKSNRDAGLLLFAAIVLDALMRQWP